MKPLRTHTPTIRAKTKLAALVAAALLAASSAGSAELTQVARDIDNAVVVALGGQPQSGDSDGEGEEYWEVVVCGNESAGTHEYVLSQKNINAAIKLCDAEGDGFSATFTPLTAVATFGNAKDIKTLLARGANINARDPDGYTPLLRAAEKNVQILLANGADVNATTAWGDTALSQAKDVRANCDADDVECRQAADKAIRMLQEAGAKEHPIAEGTADAFGNTALMLAARSGDTKEMQRLIAAGADVNTANQVGNTALMMAARASETNAAKVLLDKGANVNAANGKGETALMVAAERCDYKGNEHFCRADMVKLLLANGANVHVRDKQGVTLMRRAEMTAEMSGDSDYWKNIMAALKSAGKKGAKKRK